MLGLVMAETENLPLDIERPIFVVRLWWEPASEENEKIGEWRGSVERLALGERRFFRRLADIPEILGAQLVDLPPPAE